MKVVLFRELQEGIDKCHLREQVVIYCGVATLERKWQWLWRILFWDKKYSAGVYVRRWNRYYFYYYYTFKNVMPIHGWDKIRSCSLTEVFRDNTYPISTREYPDLMPADLTHPERGNSCFPR